MHASGEGVAQPYFSRIELNIGTHTYIVTPRSRALDDYRLRRTVIDKPRTPMWRS